MDRGSDKHSPMRDDQMKHDTDLAPDGSLHGGTPEGMTEDDVEGRAELASFLGKDAYPMVREQIIDLAIDRRAPDHVIDLVRRLPSGREFHTVNEIWSAVGGGVETERY